MFSDSEDDLFSAVLTASKASEGRSGVLPMNRVKKPIGSDDEESSAVRGKKAKIDDYEKMEMEEAKRDLADRVKLELTLGDDEVLGKVIEPEVADTFEEETAREVGATEEGEGTIQLKHQVRHQVAIPPGFPYIPISQHRPDAEPAKEYPFTLDPFQRVSVHSIQRNESVLVAAHTSAGKTVVAEYAIAQALKNKQRVIYTSPIKALSNQKYREFAEEFGDVGLMTGDVTISPNASCLVMTTEILRSMLYRGSEVVREVAWVIFDEVHYMRDKSRGVIWEETLILLPDKVRYVFLSATIPNAHEFAKWICHLHHQPCHVVYTDFRPTPLQHYLFPEGASGIHMVVDEKGAFNDTNFQKALSTLKSDSSKDHLAEEAGGSGKGLRKMAKKAQGTESDIYKIVKLIMTRNYQPVIVFSFGKRECENLAQQMSKIDFNSSKESELVETIFSNAICTLSEEDRRLPQIQNILPLLRRGIGIHHSGLLQILRETIEILFQEGLLKVLFATETFSIGLNMPAKTVVFTSVRKWDGVEQRWLSSGEYIQMSGRAGRRGLDDRGIVIMMINESMEPVVAKNMIKGESDVLNSAFNLNYNMLLNLMRVEGMTPEIILEKSFMHFQNQTHLPQLLIQLKQAELELDTEDFDPKVGRYVGLVEQLDIHIAKLRSYITDPKFAMPYLSAGRLAKVKFGDVDYGYGIIAGAKEHNFSTHMSKKGDSSKDSSKFVVDICLYIQPTIENLKTPKQISSIPDIPRGVLPALPGQGEWKVVPVLLSLIEVFTQLMVKIDDFTTKDGISKVSMIFKEMSRKFPNNSFPLLDPVENMKIRLPEVKTLKERVQLLETKIQESPLHKDFSKEEKVLAYKENMKEEVKVKGLRKKVSDAKSVAKLDELKSRKRVLRRLGFTSPSDVIELKGRVACEISTGEELLLTELIFHGLFNDLTVEQITALLSCFVFDEEVNETPDMRPELAGPFQIIQERARHLAQIFNECRIEVDEKEYLKKINPALMNVVTAWCGGVSFATLCEMTVTFEGSIIRMFKRLEELLRQMALAAKVIGNTELELKFAEGCKLIKRDIIFASSLYL